METKTSVLLPTGNSWTACWIQHNTATCHAARIVAKEYWRQDNLERIVATQITEYLDIFVRVY